MGTKFPHSLLVAGLALLGPSAASALPLFPADAAWTPITQNGVALGDAANDVLADQRDLVGSASAPVAFVSHDTDYLYVRVRVDAAPSSGGIYSSGAWAVQISSDLDSDQYEFMALLNGSATPDRVEFWQNTAFSNSPSDLAEVLLATGSVSTYARSLATGDGDFWVDLAVERVLLGLVDGSALQFVFGTNSNGNPQLPGGSSNDIAATSTGTSWAALASDSYIVPEPRSLLLLAIGFTGLSVVRATSLRGRGDAG